MKANLVSLCNRELQLDHRSLWNKDREERGRKRKIESERGNKVVKGRRRRVGQRREREREREGGGRKTGRPGPPGQTIAARWECGSRALPVPKVHSCWLGQAEGSKQPRSNSGVAPSEAYGPILEQEPWLLWRRPQQRHSFLELVKWCALVFFIHWQKRGTENGQKLFVYTFKRCKDDLFK